MTTVTPSQTSAPTAARGVLHEIVAATATKPGYIVLAIPGSNYQLHLRPSAELAARLSPANVGKRLVGQISVEARRIDSVRTGGRYIEPVHGRPRRVQGTVTAVDMASGTIIVDAGGATTVDGLPLPVRCRPTDARQRADQFAPGDLVSMDVLDGATIA